MYGSRMWHVDLPGRSADSDAHSSAHYPESESHVESNRHCLLFATASNQPADTSIGVHVSGVRLSLVYVDYGYCTFPMF
jgi:hypothetical protein